MSQQKIAVFIDNSNVFRNLHDLKAADPLWNCFYDPHKLATTLAGARELAYVGFYCVRLPAYLLSEGKIGVKRHTYSTRYYAAIEKLPLLTVKYGNLQGVKGSMSEKNVDTQISTDMVAMAALGKYDTAILVSNDGDYVSAIENVRLFNKKVELLFFKGSISMDLKKNSDVTRRARRSMFEKLEFDRALPEQEQLPLNGKKK